jgi:histidyl-tRNA synthetase
MSQKPSIPKGTRDFGPEQMDRRNFIFDTIRSVFRTYGFQPLETPSMENLSVLTGKYGDEGDQLLFKILNSGDFLKNADAQKLAAKDSKSVLFDISEKGLRYDLTVPFARWVVMNQHAITFPFKRYQIQPVWRADRPQKGRYREFFQCDADVVGTDSLVCEADIILMINEVFERLGITDFTIKMNHRKVLEGMAETMGAKGQEGPLCVAIDKLDKIGWEKVQEELAQRGFSPVAIQALEPFLNLDLESDTLLQKLESLMPQSQAGTTGINELAEVLHLLKASGRTHLHLQIDPTLARGLSYYTGAIFEVKVNNVQMGSVSGGGRYDNLTGVFGLPNVSGVGISFGVDRLYDVMDELRLFPEASHQGTKVLLAHFDAPTRLHALAMAGLLRAAGIATEVYPDLDKLKKQLNYADKKKIPYAIIIGSEEIASGNLTLKNLETGQQTTLSIDEIPTFIRPTHD